MKHLGNLDMCGIPYLVVIASSVEDSGLDEVDGYCKTDKQRIVLSDDMTAERSREVLLHEAQHALWHEAGLLDVATNVPAEALEETFIKVQTPHLIRLLDSLRALGAGGAGGGKKGTL